MLATGPRGTTALRRLHELMTQLGAQHGLQEVLQAVVDGVVDVVDFEVAVVSYLHADDTLEVMAVAGDDEARSQLLHNRIPVEELLAEFSLAEQWGVLRFVPHERLPRDENATGWVPDFQPLDDAEAWHPLDALFAPLTSPTGQLVGVLSVDLPRDRRRPGAFQRELLEMYAVQAGIAINNARQRSRLEEQVRLADSMRKIVHTVGRQLDLGRVIDDSVAPLVAGFRCHGVWIRAFEGEGERPGRGRGAIYPDEAHLVPSDALLALARTLAERCWNERQAMVFTETVAPAAGLATTEELAEARRLLTLLGATSLLFVPMGAGPECLGHMTLTRTGEEPMWDEEEVAAALSIGRDIGRAVLHARLFERERDLVGRLQRLDRYKSELIATVSHELKNPLTSIIGNLELLTDFPAAQSAPLRVIARNTERLEGLVEDLLLLSKVGDPDRPLDSRPVDLRLLVRQSVDMLTAPAMQRGVDVKVLEAPVPVVACGDPAELARVVDNVVGNAVKFTPSGGTVALAFDTVDGVVSFECRDSGMGISAADQRNLFTEFYRSSNPDALAISGTGLGLTIVRKILDRHGGSISVESELGLGSTFTVRLPAAPC